MTVILRDPLPTNKRRLPAPNLKLGVTVVFLLCSVKVNEEQGGLRSVVALSNGDMRRALNILQVVCMGNCMFSQASPSANTLTFQLFDSKTLVILWFCLGSEYMAGI